MSHAKGARVMLPAHVFPFLETEDDLEGVVEELLPRDRCRVRLTLRPDTVVRAWAPSLRPVESGPA